MSRRRKNRKKTKKQGLKQRLRRWMSYLVLAGIVFLAGLTFYLDRQIVTQFEGRRWTIPAHVYARPLELYESLTLAADGLESKLKRLGYRSVAETDRPGTYSRNGRTFAIHTRPFRFYDGPQDAMHAVVRFSDGRVSSISVSGNPTPIVRLDPLLIGSIYPGSGEDRLLVTPEQVPQELIDALLAVEDKRYYEHLGVDPTSIARAFVANLKAGEVVQGGSTLTQQLVKSYFLTPERTLWRKFREAIMAVLLEVRYEKDELLNAYINEIYLGQDGSRAVHGFGLASYFYFDKPLDELDLAEMSLLVGLVRGPSYYEPRKHTQRALDRRNLVLQRIEEAGRIDDATLLSQQAAPIGVVGRPGRSSAAYPAFLDLVHRQLKRDYDDQDLTEEGLSVFTTLDPIVQKAAEDALTGVLQTLDDELEGAVVVTTTDGGEVLALVGGRRPDFDGFNRALDARRQIGSLVKPFVYVAAFEDRTAHLASPLVDMPVQVTLDNGQIWSPENFDHQYFGEIPAVRALAESRNAATVHLGLDVGVRNVIDTLRRAGIESPLRPLPSLLLGAIELTPFEMAQAYNTLATDGFLTRLSAVREVLDADGQPLSHVPWRVDVALQPKAVFQVNEALIATVDRGTASALARLVPPQVVVAGKTGTSSGQRDSWFAGFSGNRSAIVWVGRDDNEPTGLTGASGALRVFGHLFANINAQPYAAVLPEGMMSVRIDYEHSGGPCLQMMAVAVPDGADVIACDGGTQRAKPFQRVRDWFRRLVGKNDG